MSSKSVTAFAPATVANVAVGFDILGFSLEGLGERVTVEKISTAKVQIEKIEGHPEIPLEPAKNTAGRALLQLIQDRNLKFGFKVRIEKQIPMGSGLGGSATSAVAAVVAANAFLLKKLKPEEMLHYALMGEEVASGSRHADNVAPCLFGGLNFVQSSSLSSAVKAYKIKTPADLKCVILLPKSTINTKEARRMLSEQVPLKVAVQQTSNLAGFLLGCTTKNYALIQDSLKDVLIEPQRASLIPGFYEFQKAARQSGALGCSISGSGPAIFCLVRGSRLSEKVLAALQAVAKKENISLHAAWVSGISSRGARLVKAKK